MKLPKKQTAFLNKNLKLDFPVIENAEENEKKNQRHKKKPVKNRLLFYCWSTRTRTLND